MNLIRNKLIILFNFINFKLYHIMKYLYLGIGDWGLGIGALGVGPRPHPPTPTPQTPNPQSPIPIFFA
jgi:hypothetical protein